MADVSTDQDAPALDLMTALDLDDGRVPVPGARWNKCTRIYFETDIVPGDHWEFIISQNWSVE